MLDMLNKHLMEVETQAHSMLEQTTKQMAEQQGVTEQFAAENEKFLKDEYGWGRSYPAVQISNLNTVLRTVSEGEKIQQ